MAVFDVNPGQTQDPNYLGYFKPVEPSISNKSTGMNLAAVGEGISGVAKLADTAVKEDITSTAYKQADAQRDEFTAGLEKVKSQLDNGQIPAAVQTQGGATAGKSVFDANDQMTADDVPDGVSSGLDRIAQLSGAKAASSPKINDTQYAAATLSIAKQLRAQYPGYRDYIDQEVSKASGLPVANSYYTNLMADINHQLIMRSGAQKDPNGALLNHAFNAGVPNMAQALTQRQNQDPNYQGDAYWMKQANDYYNLKSNLTIQGQQRAESTANHDQQVITEKANLTKTTNDYVAHMVSDNVALSGMSTLRDLTNYFNDAASGRIKTTDAEVQQRALQLQSYRNQIYTQMHNLTTGSASIVGSDEAEKTINNALSPIDTWIKLANAKDGPLAQFHLNQVNAIKADDQNQWLTNKDTGALSRQLLTARAIYGEQYFQSWIHGIISNNLDKPIADKFNQTAMDAVQPVTDARGQPVQTYMKQAVQDAKAKNIPDFNYYGKVTGLIGGITDPQMPATMKDKLIDWTFNPKNIGILQELKQDYRDPSTGTWIPGQSAALSRMASPAISQEIARSAQAKPQNYVNYKNFVESEFGTTLRSDIGTLSKNQGNISLGPAYSKPYMFNYGWDNKSKQLMYVDDKGLPLNQDATMRRVQQDPVASSHVREMFDTLDRVNRGLGNLKAVYQNDPNPTTDVDSYLMGKLKTLQFAPQQNAAQNDIMRAIFKANKPELTMQDIDKRLFGSK